MRLHLTILLTLAAPLLAGTPVSEERVEHAGSTYHIYRTRPDHVRLVWKDRTGTPYRTFGKVIGSHGKRAPLFIMNAGIFEPGGIPTGLHIEDGKTLHPLNLRNAPGNFFLKPNGVFWIDTTATASAWTRKETSSSPSPAADKSPTSGTSPASSSSSTAGTPSFWTATSPKPSQTPTRTSAPTASPRYS